MTTSTDQKDAAARIRELTDELVASTAQRHRRLKITVIVGVSLVALSTWGLSNVTSLTAQLDADTVAQISRQEIEQRLPDARRNAQNYLSKEAPRIVRSAIRSLISSLPQLRAYALRGFTGEIDRLNATFETKTTGLLTKIVHDTKREIDASFPDDSDRVKLQKLIARVADDFELAIANSTKSLYPQYKAEMDRIVDHLETLRTTPTEKLPREQRLHREIIDTLLQILSRRQGTPASPR